MTKSIAQQIDQYYNSYASIDVTFNREVIKAIQLYPKQILIVCNDRQWPCILYSCSMNSARLIVDVQNQFRPSVVAANNMISLRYSFIRQDQNQAMVFSVAAQIVEQAPYSIDNPDLVFLTLSFINRPPDELIKKLGQLIEAQFQARRRREDRVTINPESIKLIGINTRQVSANIDHISYKCILRDLAFSGAKLIVLNISKPLLDKEISINLQFDKGIGSIEIPGSVIRCELIEGRQDIATFVLRFAEELIPIAYKLRLSEYFKQTYAKRNQIAFEKADYQYAD